MYQIRQLCYASSRNVRKAKHRLAGHSFRPLSDKSVGRLNNWLGHLERIQELSSNRKHLNNVA